MAMHQPHAKGIVDQEAGKHEQGHAGDVEKCTHGVGHNVIKARPLALRPDMPEGCDDPVGDYRRKVERNVREGIEADRPLHVGGIDINEIICA